MIQPSLKEYEGNIYFLKIRRLIQLNNAYFNNNDYDAKRHASFFNIVRKPYQNDFYDIIINEDGKIEFI